MRAGSVQQTCPRGNVHDPIDANSGARPRPEAHMIRKTRGRPESSARLFVEQNCRLVAPSRQIRDLVAVRGSGHPVVVSGEWAGASGGLFAVQVHVVSTPQTLGGCRWWWRCPQCACRCGVLLMPSADAQALCRRCVRGVYERDYPGRWCWRQVRQWLGVVPGGPLDQLREVEALSAPRRRGVRRGRRVRARAERLTYRLVMRWGAPQDAVALLVLQRARARFRARQTR